ncbi:MAG: hypothetical protein J6Q68_00330 [Clostridia bacterium]|nr:hypothetical protein [Clostridia bacterium]
MFPYDKIESKCKYGEYDMTRKAAYTLTNSEELVEPWYYIYQNRKILLYVDQNGPVKIQYQPPSGILVAKRELGEKQSKLQTWISSKDINGGIPFSNFNSPSLNITAAPPEYTVNWNPTFATYTLKYPEADVITTVFVPYDKATVCVRTTVVNKLDKEIDITVTPSVYPYVNKPQMVAWDLPEWYLSAKSRSNGTAVTLCGKMSDPDMKKENERSVTYNLNYEPDAEFEINMSNYTRQGCFFAPRTVIDDIPLSNKMKDADAVAGFGGYPVVFAAKYKATLAPKGEKTYTQVLTVQEDTSYNKAENEFEKIYFTEKGYATRVKETDAFYEKLFTRRTVKTENPLYDNFINNFTPLQMYWVGSLDRGWPSSMRGSRDASQDFCGILPLYPEWARSVILELFFHQRTDGWMPRQVSTISREAPHDMRDFADGGAFLLELINEYLTFTRDLTILDEKVMWLDSDKESTVLEHIFTTIGYYLSEKNIGEHGLCKVWYGDWWDVMDKIGTEGRGESVTVTAQTVLNLENLAKMLRFAATKDKKYEKYLPKADEFIKKREEFIKAMRTYAYNEKGFFNGYFNDNGKWLLSDCDPDGRERLYIVSNAWAIISGCADDAMSVSVLKNIEEKSKCRVGYATASTPFYDYIDKAGRMGRGGSRYVGVYNHAESFLIRAACIAKRPDLAYDVSRYVLPFEEEYAPVEMTYSAPFAIANKYSNVDSSLHRVQLQYLSGTVSYVLRNTYNFFFGITYGYDGLTVKPSLPREFGKCSVDFLYLGKKFHIDFIPSKEKSIVFNSKKLMAESIFIADSDMEEENKLVIEY